MTSTTERRHFLQNLGGIQWPLQLSNRALDHGYSNKPLSDILEKAAPVILQVAERHIPHPLIDILDLHIWRSKTPRLSEHVLYQFFLSFNIPIFPADAEVLEGLVGDTWSTFKHNADLAGQKCPIPAEQAEVCMRILFLLVAARHYLGCDALHDAEVFQLAWSPQGDELESVPHLKDSKAIHGRLEALLSVHERAFNACLPALPSSSPSWNDDYSPPSLSLRDYLCANNRPKITHRRERMHLSQHIDKSLTLDYWERLRPLTASNKPYVFSSPPPNIELADSLTLTSDRFWKRGPLGKASNATIQPTAGLRIVIPAKKTTTKPHSSKSKAARTTSPQQQAGKRQRKQAKGSSVATRRSSRIRSLHVPRVPPAHDPTVRQTDSAPLGDLNATADVQLGKRPAGSIDDDGDKGMQKKIKTECK